MVYRFCGVPPAPKRDICKPGAVQGPLVGPLTEVSLPHVARREPVNGTAPDDNTAKPGCVIKGTSGVAQIDRTKPALTKKNKYNISNYICTHMLDCKSHRTPVAWGEEWPKLQDVGAHIELRHLIQSPPGTHNQVW